MDFDKKTIAFTTFATGLVAYFLYRSYLNFEHARFWASLFFLVFLIIYPAWGLVFNRKFILIKMDVYPIDGKFDESVKTRCAHISRFFALVTVVGCTYLVFTKL
tara:strand:- start:2687 stop:2998 length:312 start_codon:yes stop_codon:yes gene_type:complete